MKNNSVGSISNTVADLSALPSVSGPGRDYTHYNNASHMGTDNTAPGLNQAQPQGRPKSPRGSQQPDVSHNGGGSDTWDGGFLQQLQQQRQQQHQQQQQQQQQQREMQRSHGSEQRDTKQKRRREESAADEPVRVRPKEVAESRAQPNGPGDTQDNDAPAQPARSALATTCHVFHLCTTVRHMSNGLYVRVFVCVCLHSLPALLQIKRTDVLWPSSSDKVEPFSTSGRM